MRHTAAVLAVALVAAGCSKNPATGKRQLSLVSEEQEIALGKQTAEQVLQTMPRYPDEKVQAYVADIGKRIAAASERPKLPWSFTVLDDPTVNAFALPGGPIFITRGILTYMTSEAELASVMGHEIAHITARHSVEQLSKAQLAQVGLGLGSILSESVAQVGQAAGAGLQLLFLKFGRDHERQADELGFKYMVGQGFDPREMAKMFATLERSSGGAGRMPGWLSTHPDPGDRARTAEKRAAELKDATKLKVGREEFLALLNGMTFGEDPRQGFFQGDAFLHPDLAFRIDFPAGWKKQNTPGAVIAVSPQQDAAIQLTLAGKMSPEEAAKRFFAQKGVKPASLAGQAPPAGARYFAAQTEEGPLAGLVAFLPHGGATVQVLGFAGAPKVPSYDPAFRKAVASFGKLTDPAALGVKPARIELVKVPREMSVAEFAAEFPSTAPPETIATLNGLAKDGRFQAGQTAKRVVGGVAPPGGGGGGGPPSAAR